MIRKYLIPLAAVGMLALAIYRVVVADQKVVQTKPPIAPATSPYRHVVAGAGLVESQTENISVGATVPGLVTEVLVRESDEVQPGDVLFRLDDRQLQAELKVRQASLAAAKAQLARLEAQPRKEEIPVNQAKLREARANLAMLEDQKARTEAIRASGGVSMEEVVSKRQQVQVAREQVARAQAELDLQLAGAWKEDLLVARAQVEQAQAQVSQTLTEIDRLTIRALVSGEVLQVNIRPGEYVGAPPSQELMVLGNVDSLHVRVDIDENDIPRFRPGAPAQATLRGSPETKFRLRFIRVEPYVIPKKSLTGDNTERVDTRVLQVIYALERTTVPVYVGQQMDVFIAEDPSASAS